MSHEMSTGDEAGALTRYERGVSLVEVAKGALTRFLPASFVSMTGLAMALDLSVGGGLVAATGALGFAATMTVGFGAGLLGIRRWLYPDAKVSGRRSLVGGLLSPLALFIAVGFSSGMSQLEALGALFVVGVLLALGLFFAWLSPTPGEMLGGEYAIEPEESEPLPSSSAF